MENFNNVPSQGKFGDSVAVVNENFMLAQQKMEELQAQYDGLTQSDIIVGSLPASGIKNTIYRVPNTTSYSDYMWNGTQFVKMAEYDNAIDDEPTPNSNNLVKSGGVVDALASGAVYDVSSRNPTGGSNSDGKFTLEYILTNADTLIPTSWRKGGMTIRFVDSSDNKYVQYRLMAQTFSNDEADWQGVDDNLTVGSRNLAESGSVLTKIGYIPIQGSASGTANKYIIGTSSKPGISFKGKYKLTVNSISDYSSWYIREFYEGGTASSLLISSPNIERNYDVIIGISVFKGPTTDAVERSIDITILDSILRIEDKKIDDNYTDSVHLSSQSLTDEQKEQVKSNLDITDNLPVTIKVDDYSELVSSGDWSPAINAAIAVGVSSRQGVYTFGVVEFTEGKEYSINDTIRIIGDVILKGNGATLKRANGQKVTVTQAIDSSGSTEVHVSGIWGNWKVGDKAYIINGNTKNDVLSASDITITAIDSTNNIITLSTSVKNIPVDAEMIRSFCMIEGVQYPLPTIAKIYNLNFNGNANKNNYSYYWYVNPTVSVYGYGTIIDSCGFYNIPNENIITAGAVVSNCLASDLNGSFVHLSCPAKNKLTYNQYMGTRITNNRVLASNKISPTVTGHSWAVVEQSWNPGFLIVADNYFSGYNNGSCFEIQKATPESTGTDFVEERKYVIIANNIFENYANISRTPVVGDSIKDKIMVNNVFKHCGTTDWITLFEHELIVDTNIYTDGTIVNSGGNTYRYRVNSTYTSAPSKSTLTTDYVSLPVGGEVFVSQINKLYKKILTASGVEDWLELQLI